MKRKMLLILGFLLVFTLAACGKKTKDETAGADNTERQSAPEATGQGETEMPGEMHEQNTPERSDETEEDNGETKETGDESVKTGEDMIGVFDFEKKKVLLNSGYEMPILGLGTYSLDYETCVNSVMTHLENGGRLIDTAYMYHNEEAVGEGVRRAMEEYHIPREEIFVITKIYPTQYDDPEAAIELALEIAEAHGVSSAQVILRWDLQRGIVVIPGSSNPEHIRENLDLFGFSLTDEEMERISEIDRGEKHDWY